MKTYAGSLRFILFSSIAFAVFTGAYLAVNLYYQRFFFVGLFGLMTLGYVVFVVLLATDLISKDTKAMKVHVVHVDREIVIVRKPNGKNRKIRVLPSEVGRYGEGEALELTLTKRTGRIVNVKGEIPTYGDRSNPG